MSFAVVLEGMTLIAYLVILAGGMQKRAAGWKILSGLLSLVGAVEFASMAIMVRHQLVVSTGMLNRRTEDPGEEGELTVSSVGLPLRRR